MSDASERQVAVLTCSNPDCEHTFNVAASHCKADGVHSLHAALEAHKQGWKAREGQMLCPDCACSSIAAH